ncbi:MAG: Gfo/Idh/MocA family oxidoreductase [Planctomycetaceae bacterium]|nr:Gfo/Idh/MocA family oxidoreductase [Planctomycetaceae bacterium]
MNSVSRRQFLAAASAAGAAFVAPRLSAHTMAADDVSLGFISCGGRANQLMGHFTKSSGVQVNGLCDPDESRLGKTHERFPKARVAQDLRRILDDPSIDAVVVSTCNHWHCLAAIWAMQAGKHVYVEKPLSHSQWEGQQTVNAARRYKRICQVGTQQRSDPMQAQIKQFLHEEKALGEILSVRVNRIGVRGPIGKRATPLEIDKSVAWDLWLGPAQDKPIYRDNLQYDWHWDWNTGSGEMGNWGVHVLDDVRNVVFRDAVTLPKRIVGGGGRFAWNDAGETPNAHYVWFDTGNIPVVIALSNLTAGPGAKGSPKHPGPGSGYIVYCENGRYEGQRGRGQAFDKAGKVIREFRGNSGNDLHQQNFIDAVRAGDAGLLNTEVQIGHHSTGWCNLANIAVLAGGAYSADAAASVPDESGLWSGLLSEMQDHLKQHGITMNSREMKLSPMLTFDPASEQFVGDHAADANQWLKRQYRSPYEVPEVTA